MTREASCEVAELGVVAAVLAHAVEASQHAAGRAAAWQGVVGDGRIDSGLLAKPVSRLATAASTSGASAAAPGRPPRRAAISARQSQRSSASGLGLVEVAGRQQQGLEAHAIELLRLILQRQGQDLEHVRGRRMRDAQRDLALPARGLELDVAGAQGSGELGRLGERCRDGPCETLGARWQRATGLDGQHDRDAVARLRVEHRDAAGARVLEQAAPAIAQRARARAARRWAGRSRASLGGVHPGLVQSELGAQLGEDVVADGGDHLWPIEEAPAVDLAGTVGDVRVLHHLGEWPDSR